MNDTIKSLVEKIEANNEKFAKLPKSKQRVVIAQDCLERIKVGHLSPATGRFINETDFRFLLTGNHHAIVKKQDDLESCSLKERINEIPQCSACAKGSLFLSLIGRVNKFDVKDFQLKNGNDTKDNPHARLMEYFDIKQLALIELVFENQLYIDEDLEGKTIRFNSSTYDKAELFHYAYHLEEERMIAICENIIKNKGTFKL